MRILLVFEFPPGGSEWQLRDLAQSLQEKCPGLETAVCAGWIEKYAPGGLKLSRLLNSGWVHGAAFLRILFGRYDAVLVRTAPPLIQLTVAFACRLRNIPYWIWLMDAHPEIEAVLWKDKPLVGSLCVGLEKLNVRCLQRAGLVIVLDPSMRRRLVPTLGDDRVIVCPTWGRNVTVTT